MRVTIEFDIPTKEVKTLTGVSKSTMYRISQNGKDVGKQWESVGKILNAKVLSAKVLPDNFGKVVGKPWESSGKTKERENENERKEDVSPTPPIEENKDKEKKKENSLPPTPINKVYVSTPLGGRSPQGIFADAETEDVSVVVEGVKPKAKRKSEPPLKTMEQLAAETERRSQDFYYSLVKFVPTYGKEMIRNFYDYWSETNKSKTKMRWETEKTWVVELRLKRWADKNNSYTRRHGNEWSDEDEARRRRAEGAARIMQQFLQAK